MDAFFFFLISAIKKSYNKLNIIIFIFISLFFILDKEYNNYIKYIG